MVKRAWDLRLHSSCDMLRGNEAMTSILYRCPWATNELAVPYHDGEWGVPVHDDRLLFEFLVLEGAQAGLSWNTILKKRERYRLVFDNFDAPKVARYDARKVNRLLTDPGIVRNRLKISAAIQNAKAFLAVQKEFESFDVYIWRFVGGQPKGNAWRSMKDVPACTPESDAMSKDLQRRGFKFVGSTICCASCKRWEWSTIISLIVSVRRRLRNCATDEKNQTSAVLTKSRLVKPAP